MNANTNPNPNLTSSEIERLENSRSEQEWNSICDDVKRARGGQYPPDWFVLVIISGLASKVSLNW